MQMIDNEDEGYKRLGYAAMACKGVPNGRRKKYEIVA